MSLDFNLYFPDFVVTNKVFIRSVYLLKNSFFLTFARMNNVFFLQILLFFSNVKELLDSLS